jgi:chromate transporter
MAPIVVAGITRGWHDILVEQGTFFSKAALITFGGAYAVLPYVAQQAVEHYQWLNTAQMMAGLALAETTPGPLIMVLQFVGFIGAWQNPGDLPPLLAATLGAAITTWSTFLPCFLFILVFAPLVDRVRHLQALDAALSTITAAVVGVILNLAVWFGQHVLFPLGRPDSYAIFLALLFFLGLWRGKWEIIPVVFAGGLLGLVGKLFLGL